MEGLAFPCLTSEQFYELKLFVNKHIVVEQYPDRDYSDHIIEGVAQLYRELMQVIKPRNFTPYV